jgi:hypothetical protein
LVEGPQEPIEVELVSSDGVGPEHESAVSHPIPRRATWIHSEAGRLSLVAAGAALVALLIGWTVGRATAPGGDVVTSAPPAATTPTGPSSETTNDTIAPVESTSTTTSVADSTERVVAPTTAPAPMGVRTAEIDEAVAGLPVEIVATLTGRNLAVLDLAAGTVDERTVDRPPFGPGGIHAGDGWVLLPSWDDDVAWTLLSQGGIDDVELGSANRVLDVAGADTFWRIDDELLERRPGVAEEFAFDGTPTGAALELPTAPGWADPLGGLLVPTVGGVYRVAGDGVTQLSDGTLLGVNATHAVAFECDDGLVCGYQLIDRASQQRTVVVPGGALGASPRFDRPWWPLPSSAISADGDAMITIWFDEERDSSRPVLGVLDLVDGDFRALMEARDRTSIGWSPDGGFVFFADGGRLFAFERASGDVVTVTDDLFAVEAFAIRPTAG